CWGAAILENVKDLRGSEARKATGSYLKEGTITAAFKRVNKGTVTYSHRQHTKMETRSRISVPYEDRKTRLLPATPNYSLARCQNCICEDTELSCGMATITVHLEREGIPLSFKFLLDFIEVAKSHSGANLAEVFAGILCEFGIKYKTRCFNHIISLTGKSLTKLFDASTSMKREEMTDVELSLAELADGLDLEDLQMQLKDIVNCTGISRVLLSLPVPVPVKTETGTGTGKDQGRVTRLCTKNFDLTFKTGEAPRGGGTDLACIGLCLQA
ncbi:hypothetical protein K435DRAFT_814426, partial [Dendrothele bispora CBS 962.96]